MAPTSLSDLSADFDWFALHHVTLRGVSQETCPWRSVLQSVFKTLNGHEVRFSVHGSTKWTINK